MNDKDCLEAGIKRAQKIGHQKQFKIGQAVTHPSEKLVYEFCGIEDGKALLGLPAEVSPTGEAVKKRFPLDEIFDPNIAKEQAFEAKREAIAARFPDAIVVRVVR